MSSIQLENGYTRIANKILEEMAKIKLSPTQYRLLFVIWRFTYGFNRKEHKISLAFLSEATGCDLRQIQRELKKLEERRLIFQKIKSGSSRRISFNKNYNEWIGRRTIGKITNGETAQEANGENTNDTFGEIGKEEKNNKKTKEKNDHINKTMPYLKYEELFGALSPALRENLKYWIEKSQFQEPEKIICLTIERAGMQLPNKPEAYIISILKKLHSLELYTLAAVKEYNANFDARNMRKRKGVIPNLKDMFEQSEGISSKLNKRELKEMRDMEEEFPF